MKKKLLFLIHTLGGGGAEKVLVNLVSNLPKDKYEITVMTVVDTGIYIEELPEHIKYKTIFRLPWKRKKKKKENVSGSLLNKKTIIKKLAVKMYTSFWKIMPITWLYKLCIREKYDYEIAFLEGICAKIISKSNNVASKKLCWIHVDLSKQHKSKNVFRSFKEESEVYNKFDQIVCVSDYVKKEFLNMFETIPESKMVVKYNPIDRNDILKKSQKKNFIRKNPNTFLICSVGRLNKQKSYLRLLACLNQLKKEGIDFECWIIGEGTDRQNLENYCIEKNLKKNVVFWGFQENPYCLMSQADLYVCSSIAEGFSTSIVEATILGLPIVTTNCSGMEEILGDSEYGIITENDEKCLYLGIKSMIVEKQKYDTYKEKSEQRGKQFEMNYAISQIEKLFNKKSNNLRC